VKVGHKGRLAVGDFPQPYQPLRDRSARAVKSRCNIGDKAAGIERLNEPALIFVAPGHTSIVRQRRVSGVLSQLTVNRRPGYV
jgi:hypothetical protein